jgi:hypothetical protein
MDDNVHDDCSHCSLVVMAKNLYAMQTYHPPYLNSIFCNLIMMVHLEPMLIAMDDNNSFVQTN